VKPSVLACQANRLSSVALRAAGHLSSVQARRRPSRARADYAPASRSALLQPAPASPQSSASIPCCAGPSGVPRTLADCGETAPALLRLPWCGPCPTGLQRNPLSQAEPRGSLDGSSSSTGRTAHWSDPLASTRDQTVAPELARRVADAGTGSDPSPVALCGTAPGAQPDPELHHPEKDLTHPDYVDINIISQAGRKSMVCVSHKENSCKCSRQEEDSAGTNS